MSDGPWELPADWRWATLGELISPAKPQRAGDRDLPILSMTMHNGLVDQSSKFTKRVAGADLSGYKVVEHGQLVVGFPIDEGVLDFQSLYNQAIVSPAYQVWNIEDNSSIYPEFLLRFLRSDTALTYYSAKLRSSTARRRSLNRGDFLNLPVPLPPLSEQRRIAEILDRKVGLMEKSCQLDNEIEELTGSIFDRMFPARTFPHIHFRDIIQRIDSGTSPKCDSQPARPGQWGVLKLSAVTSGKYIPEENKLFQGIIEPLRKNEVHSGDLLMTRKNTPELVGAACLVEEEHPNLLIPDLIYRIVPDYEKVRPSYLQKLLMRPAMRQRIRAISGGSSQSMSNISKSRLQEVSIPLPPLALQIEFDKIREKLMAYQERVTTRSDSLNSMFTAIQSRAFRGEL
ncbi:restriction endonuclease subunit S [Corynebacterium glyciniphilum]|uniref:restriction endonuclease subunit S n=1 Tax=Corynebacterium glyciniphilum TaxID=1404244 RepID=UPI0011AB80B2|nr:restriction endonuclease subunit S [Corynebacterium glyciniphilum]